MAKDILVINEEEKLKELRTDSNILFALDVEKVLDSLPDEPIFDLVVTSPPYDIGKSYEKIMPLKDYIEWQRRIINKIYPSVPAGYCG